MTNPTTITPEDVRAVVETYTETDGYRVDSHTDGSLTLHGRDGKIVQQTAEDWQGRLSDRIPSSQSEWLRRQGKSPKDYFILSTGCLLRAGARPLAERAAKTIQDRQHAAEKARRDALERAIPGLHEIADLRSQVRDAWDRHHAAFNAMMGDENNDGARPPEPIDPAPAARLAALEKANPRAVLYLRARADSERSLYHISVGGDGAMACLGAGGSIEDAQKIIDAAELAFHARVD